MSDATIQDKTNISGQELGGPGKPDPARCSQAAIAALSRIAGRDMRLAQVQLDMASREIGEGGVAVIARIDKRTRSILFASVEGRANDELVFRAQALFSKA